MKTSNYLIGFAALASLTLVGCSDNDFIGTGGSSGFSKGNGEISFNAGSGKITRGEEITGMDAATKLGNKFTVYGWKTNSAASGATVGSHEDVFQDYLLTWATNTAGTTESNTNNWEYVGNTSQPIDGAGIDQTIKYWDYSANRYDFIAWTIKDGKGAVLKARPQVTDTDVEPGLTFNAPTASALGDVYVSDKYTATPEGAPLTEVLANASNAKHTFGKYMGKDNDDNASHEAVRLQFRSLAAKVRIGIYETVPGYKISDVIFYKENADKKWNYTYGESDADYPSSQLDATLFAENETFARSGDLTVRYHDATYISGDAKKDNTAFTGLSNLTKSTFFAFGKLTNTKGAGEKTAIAAGEAIGTTSNTATMSIGNDENKLYTYVFPMEENGNALHLKVNYKLTSTDGSGETIYVSGANAVVPANFAQWMANYAYTYLFKISDNTNGSTNPSAGPEGLYPITFDAVVVDAQEGYQETITTVNDNSITTYQDGSEVTVNDEYLSSKGDIYVAIKGTPDLTAGTNIKLFICEDKDAKETLSEEVAANYINNGMIFTNVSALLTVNAADVEVPNSSGAGHGIKFAAGKVAKFAPVANTIYVVEYTIGGIKSYKIIKIENGTATQTYAVTMDSGQSAATNETAAFTITNTNGNYKVTGAKSLVVVKKGDAPVTDQFVINEPTEGNYTVTPKTAVAGTDYKVYFNNVAAGNTFSVTAPVWTPAKVYVEEGTTVTAVLTNKSGTGAAAIAGVTPTVPSGLKATKTNDDGQTTITAAAGESGEKIVSYNGSNLTVEVDKFTLTPSRTIINVGDADHKTATLTLTNANDDGTPVATKTITSSNTSAVAGGTLSGGTMTITANAAGIATLSADDTKAKVNIEVVNYVITNNNNGTITLTKDGTPISGQVFSTTGGLTVTATSTTGKYKVSGTGTGKISFKYKGVVVADVDITL